jgi:hypothetical protein
MPPKQRKSKKKDKKVSGRKQKTQQVNKKVGVSKKVNVGQGAVINVVEEVKERRKKRPLSQAERELARIRGTGVADPRQLRQQQQIATAGLGRVPRGLDEYQDSIGLGSGSENIRRGRYNQKASRPEGGFTGSIQKVQQEELSELRNRVRQLEGQKGNIQGAVERASGTDVATRNVPKEKEPILTSLYRRDPNTNQITGLVLANRRQNQIETELRNMEERLQAQVQDDNLGGESQFQDARRRLNRRPTQESEALRISKQRARERQRPPQFSQFGDGEVRTERVQPKPVLKLNPARPVQQLFKSSILSRPTSARGTERVAFLESNEVGASLMGGEVPDERLKLFRKREVKLPKKQRKSVPTPEPEPTYPSSSSSDTDTIATDFERDTDVGFSSGGESFTSARDSFEPIIREEHLRDNPQEPPAVQDELMPDPRNLLDDAPNLSSTEETHPVPQQRQDIVSSGSEDFGTPRRSIYTDRETAEIINRGQLQTLERRDRRVARDLDKQLRDVKREAKAKYESKLKVENELKQQQERRDVARDVVGSLIDRSVDKAKERYGEEPNFSAPDFSEGTSARSTELTPPTALISPSLEGSKPIGKRIEDLKLEGQAKQTEPQEPKPKRRGRKKKEEQEPLPFSSDEEEELRGYEETMKGISKKYKQRFTRRELNSITNEQKLLLFQNENSITDASLIDELRVFMEANKNSNRIRNKIARKRRARK